VVTDRQGLATVIAARLRSQEASLEEQFRRGGGVHAFVLDDVLDPAECRRIGEAFPDPGSMMLRKSVREHKLVSAQMDRHSPLLEEAVYAFQAPEVVDALARVTGIGGLLPDEHLYAGGISVMERGHFLNPHIDNSHDKDRRSYRVLNLLFYVTPDWQEEYGGNLELWDGGPRRAPVRTIVSRFNRMVVMATTRSSWHSVSRVVHDSGRRCISNYYFAARAYDDRSGEGPGYFHPTSFRGFADEPVKDAVLRADALARGALRKVRRGGLVRTRHVYRQP
jgi:Rps23 Pro-64 3,4-dihydroxylase Tpa1-like proline 4-hydroxylase